MILRKFTKEGSALADEKDVPLPSHMPPVLDLPAPGVDCSGATVEA
jgi:hypothetical protein